MLQVFRLVLNCCRIVVRGKNALPFSYWSKWPGIFGEMPLPPNLPSVLQTRNWANSMNMAIPNHEPYQYFPITDHDGIRLIVLQPSADKATTVQCEILHVTLRQAQDEICDHYTALSYVWRDPDDTTAILVKGYPLRVTKSLERSFRYLRDEKRHLNVWADGVCINQKDENEKASKSSRWEECMRPLTTL
jgi:hypothetical protein